MEFIKSLFADKLVDDDRQPILIFRAMGDSWGIFAPNFMLWQQLIWVSPKKPLRGYIMFARHYYVQKFVKYSTYSITTQYCILQLLLLQIALQSLFAVINYRFIVPNRRTSAAYLLGWGVIIPIALYFPYMIIETLQIHSKVIKMAAGTSSFIIGFRTVEAMYGTSPHTVETSLTTYLNYYSTLLHFEWDPKTSTRRKIKARELLVNAGLLMAVFHLLSLVLSFELHYNFEPFLSSKVKLNEFHFNSDLLSPAHLGNAYCLAVLTYLTLFFGFELTSLGEQFKGYYTPPVFFNPLYTSRSPSEFWGRKWNLMIHKILKHGAYLPARQFFVRPHAAVVLTFVVSGLIHDYVWSLMFHQHEHMRDANGQCLDCFAPILLKLTAFFAWNGLVMLLERPFGPFFQTYTQRLPTVMVSTLVVLTALPVSHWYSGDLAVGGYFHDLSIGVWQIRKLTTS